MSAQGGEKWQRAGGRSTPSNQTPSQSQQNRGHSQNQSNNSRSNTPQSQRDGGSKSNAWGNNSNNNDRRRSQGPAQHQNQNQSARSGPLNTAPAVQDAEKDAGNKTANASSLRTSAAARDVAELMRASYREAIAASGHDEKALIYRGQNDTGTAKAARTGAMSNGQNFLTELSKQVRAL